MALYISDNNGELRKVAGNVSGYNVIETYTSSDGKTWYRKWSDGWKECGGTFYGINNEKTVILPNITYNNNNYILMITPHLNSGTQTVEYNRLGYDKTTSSFKTTGTSSQLFDWYCCGY